MAISYQQESDHHVFTSTNFLSKHNCKNFSVQPLTTFKEAGWGDSIASSRGISSQPPNTKDQIGLDPEFRRGKHSKPGGIKGSTEINPTIAEEKPGPTSLREPYIIWKEEDKGKFS